MKSITISIITCTFNSEKYLKNALKVLRAKPASKSNTSLMMPIRQTQLWTSSKNTLNGLDSTQKCNKVGSRKVS